MKWVELTVHTTTEAVEAVSHFLHELGAGGVSIEEAEIPGKRQAEDKTVWYELPENNIPAGQAILSAYFAESAEVLRIKERLRRFLESLADCGIDRGSGRIETNEVDDQDWANAWKEYYKPVRISDRIVIKPTWEDYTPRKNDLVIELDPGMAFGTGTHASTALCLRMLEKTQTGGERVIDVGTGSGILAIAAAKLGAKRVLAIDVDPVAVSSACENIGANGLSDRIVVCEGDLLNVLTREGAANPSDFAPADIIVANLLAGIIISFAADAARALADGGVLIASGIIERKENEVAQALADAGLRIVRRMAEGEWVALSARKQ
ncbi:MAG TPA: 50S ribosomal protein L11 methyltransferase [Bacilli bacterium]